MAAHKKKTEKKSGHGYLLDAWLPPANAGELAGCVTTSFTFDAGFFVEECLARCLNLQSDAEEDGLAHLVELEEKLAQSRCIALVDQAHASGTRTLRWDLLVARVPEAIMHAKVTVLVWAAHVRLIVASANITAPGYRTNREVFGVLDYHPESRAPLPVLQDILGFLSQLARQHVDDSPARGRWMEVLRLAGKKAATWGDAEPGGIRAVLTGLGQPDALTQLREDVWPMKRPPSFARVGSPFFDNHPDRNLPAERLWSMIARGSEIWWEVAGRVESRKPHVVSLKAPRTLQTASPPAPAAQKFILMPEKDEDDERRDLHAKWLWLKNDRAALYLMGSANFTSSGLGLGSRPNVEAGLAYIAHGTAETRALGRVRIVGEDVGEDADLRFDPAKNDEEADGDSGRLPLAFGSAVFTGTALRLSFHADRTPPAGWEARANTSDGRVIATEAVWTAAGRATPWEIPWDDTTPPSLLALCWPKTGQTAWWPVTLESAAALPPPDALRNLSLEKLIEILASDLRLSEVIKRQMRPRKPTSEDPGQSLDAHDLVQTSHHLLRRAGRVGAALTGLRRRLEQPATSLDALAWRLGRPVGALALADALQKEAQSAEERLFLLTELMLQLGHVTLPKETPPGCLPTRTIRAEILKTQRTLWTLIEATLAQPGLDDAVRMHAHAARDYHQI